MFKIRMFLRLLTGIVLIITFFSSCVPLKKQIYFQAAADSTKTTYKSAETSDHKLQVGNNLYVRVFSLDQKTYDFFNLSSGSATANSYYDAGIYLSSYAVDRDGYVDLPFIGKVFVLGLTIDETKTKIHQEIAKYLNETTVVVKLVNYNVTVIGEVARPGQYKIYQDKINILGVISLAGDLTTFAKRDDIVLIRKSDKSSKMYHINLLTDNVLESEFYNIMPDDIIYVMPVKGKNFAFQAFPYTLVISSISLALALFALFKK